MIYGFCLEEQRDVVVEHDRRCQVDGSLVIPASYGNRLQQWVNGAWSPEVARPDGYVWKPKQLAAQVIADPVSAPCPHCDLTFSYQPRGGDAPRYCSPKCKGAAARARRREARSA